ncbi:c type lectin domain containing protein, partial [Aphelenchoides avenae]
VFHDANQTWEFANGRCASNGAHLASIHSVAEQQFIQEISATGMKMVYSWPTYCVNGVWIGFNDVHEIGFYKWSDGTPYDYSNWGPGRPLDRGREYSYGMYYPDYFADSNLYNIFNTWDNVPNTYLARASICKKAAIG